MTERSALQRCLEEGIAALGLTLPPEAVPRLLDYQALLARWNATYNLTAVRDPAGMVTRHLLDSLAILPYVTGATLADLKKRLGHASNAAALRYLHAVEGRDVAIANALSLLASGQLEPDPPTRLANSDRHSLEGT